MSDWVVVEEEQNLRPGQSTIVTIDDTRIGLFNVEGAVYAIDNRCPHRGASLGAGEFEGAIVSCPLHHWKFNLITGVAVEQSGFPLKKFDAKIEDSSVLIDRESIHSQNCDGIQRHLIRYGSMGWVGVFGTIDEQVTCQRGDFVEVRTNRGLELGEVLSAPGEFNAQHVGDDKPTGEVLSKLTERQVSDYRQHQQLRTAKLTQECTQALAEVGSDVAVVDSELLFDRSSIVFYYVGEQSEQLGQLTAKFGESSGVAAAFHPLVEPEGGGGCGTSGCGCHTE